MDEIDIAQVLCVRCGIMRFKDQLAEYHMFEEETDEGVLYRERGVCRRCKSVDE